MTVVVWVVENTWRACVPAAAEAVRPGEDVVLLHVLPDIVPGVARGAFAGLLGRGHRAAHDPGAALERAAEESAAALLDEAVLGFGGSARPLLVRGRVEREVLAAAQGARLLVLARDTSADDAAARAPSPQPGAFGPPGPPGRPGPPPPPPGPDLPPPPPPTGGRPLRGGPHSLGPATRFVVDHAPCAVLLVWPESSPS